MRIRHVKINNFRGIKNAELTFPQDQRLICLIGPGDSTKTTILKAIHYVLWPNWNLTVSSNDFYECNTENPIIIEVTFDEFPKEFKDIEKYGFYLRGTTDAEPDEPTDENCFLTARLEIDDLFEPKWSIVSNRLKSKAFALADRQKISPGMIGIDFFQNLNWGQGSALVKYIDPKEEIRKNLSKFEAESRKIGDYQELDKIGNVIKKVADGYGVSINGEINNKVSLKSKNVSSVIELFEDDKPFNQRGYGSKKLINLGLQVEGSKIDSLLLIDEIEIGLEPYRQRNLIHKLKQKVNQKGQVLFTTHSPVVLAELDITKLIIVHSENGNTSIQTAASQDDVLNSEMQKILRRVPEAFLTRRVLVCEGKTEVGFIRAMDEAMQKKENHYMASQCVSYVDGNGGGTALDDAKGLSELGYEVAILIDNDVRDEDKKKKELLSKGIPVFTWPMGKCLETALLPLLPIENLESALQWDSDYKEATWDELLKQNLSEEKYLLKHELNSTEVLQVAQICSQKSFFKRIAGGERLGKAVFSIFDKISSESEEKKTIENIIKWIDKI